MASTDVFERIAGREDDLDPATVELIRHNLEIIDEAIREIREALDEDPDVLLAMAGRVSSDLQEAIRSRPKLFADLIRSLKDAPDPVVDGIAREVRDGRW